MGSQRGGQGSFSERDFYLAEFRGRTLAIALPAMPPEDLSHLGGVLVELRANRIGVLLVSQDRPLLEKLAPDRVVSTSDSDWLAALWRALGSDSVGAVAVPPTRELEPECRRIVQRIRPAKLVWLDPAGPLRTPAGDRISLVDMRGLAALLADVGGPPAPQLDGPLSPQRRSLLREIQTLVGDQLPAVNLCSVRGLADDLFTFEGSGTFFARERYLRTRSLAPPSSG